MDWNRLALAVACARLQQAQEERDRAYKEKGTLFLDVIRAKDKCDAAIERAEAAEALAEKRNDALNASAPYLLGTGVPNAVLRQVGLARRVTPAEAQAQRGEGDD